MSDNNRGKPSVEKMRYILSTFLILLYCSHAYAEQYNDGTFTVSDVKVAARGQSAVEAQKKAMDMAKVKAFRMLVERLAPQSLEQTANIAPGKIEECVDSVEVNSQQNSKVSYQATMTVHFDESSVKRLLGSNITSQGTASGPVVIESSGATSAEMSRPPIVVVPLFIDQGSINLWGEQNPWLNAWSRRDKFSVSSPLQVPMGDLKDVSLLNAQQVMSSELNSLAELAKRYGASEVVVATLRKDSQDPMAPMALEANLLSANGQMIPLNHSETLTSAGSPKVQFDQAINVVVSQLESHLKNTAPSRTVSGNNDITARVKFADQKEWFSIQNSLRDSMAVKRMVLRSLSRREATVAITYQGSITAFEEAMRAKGLQIEQIDGNTWLLRRVATAATYTTY